MAHFAKISDDGTVLEVIVVRNEVLLDDDGVEQEQIGRDFCQATFGGAWVQTSYNHNFRKRFAFLGGKYDSTEDVFLFPQPYPSWTLDSDYEWQPPTPYPDDGRSYIWSEQDAGWVINPSPSAEI